MFRKIGLFSSENKEISWWWFGIKVGVVIALIIWWWVDNRNKKFVQESPGKLKEHKTQSIPLPEEDTSLGESSPGDTKKPENPEAVAAPPPEPDDLTKIEGIGPKINATLQEAGIRTFAQLSVSKATVIKRILVDAGIRLGDPGTWPEQAALAAKGDWAALDEFQSSLKGGRRVG